LVQRKRDTSRNKTSLNREYFAHNLFVYSKRIEVGVKRAVWRPFQFWRPKKIREKNWIRFKDYSL